MRRSRLRAALFVLCGVLLAAAVSLAIGGCTLALVLRLAVPGVILLFALLVEHWRYKLLKDRRPDPDWVSTDERFVDPESGKLVAVFHKPSTGERRYVAV